MLFCSYFQFVHYTAPVNLKYLLSFLISRSIAHPIVSLLFLSTKKTRIQPDTTA